MASDARAPTADLATSQAPSDQAAPTAAPALTAPPSPSPTLPKLEPYRLRTPLQAAYLVRDFIAPADEVRISRLYRELIRQAYMLQRIEALAGSEEIETISSSPRTSSSTTYRSKATPAGWKTIGGSSPRRSMTFGGQIIGRSLVPGGPPMPDFLRWTIEERLRELGIFEGARGGKPNHLLVNGASAHSHCADCPEYTCGRGIMAHEDGAAYWPRVATLSLGSHTILDLYEYADAPTDDKAQSRAIRPEPSFSILLPPRSLFVLAEDLYARCLHGIAARETDTAEQLGRCVNWTMSDALSGDGPDVTEAAGWDRGRRVSLTLRTVERVRKLL